MSAAADTETPQGVLAVVAAAALPEALPGPALMVVLDGMQDPGNLGTILRTALAAGAGAVITSPGCADVFAPKVVRAGMGAHFRLPVLPGRCLDVDGRPSGRAQGPAVRSGGRHSVRSGGLARTPPR